MRKQRVVFCTYPSIYSSIVLKKLLSDNTIEIVGIVNSSRVLSKRYNTLWASLKQIQICGWRYSSYLFLVTNFFSWSSLFVPNHRKKLQIVQKYAQQMGIPVLATRDINEPQSVKFIQSIQPEILLAAHFNQLVKDEILNMPGLSCLNIHPSLLPAYKGVDPVFYALLKRETKLGVSLHTMAETFDTGMVISQTSVKLESSQSSLLNIFEENCGVFNKGAELFLNYVKKSETRNILRKVDRVDVVGHREQHYDSWPSPKLVKEFRKKRYRLIRVKSLLQSFIRM